MFNKYQIGAKDKHKKIENLINCAEREIELRRRVYPKLVIQGKKTEGAARYEIQSMKEILIILHLVNRLNFLDQPNTKTERMIFENTHPDMKNE